MSTTVVVISIRDATERRAAFSARAEGATLRWSYVDALSGLGPELSYDPDEAIVTTGRALYRGELECYASHYSAWRTFLGSGAPQMIVLEDDTIVDWIFLAKLAAVDLQASGISDVRLLAKRAKFVERAHRLRHWVRRLLDGRPTVGSLAA